MEARGSFARRLIQHTLVIGAIATMLLASASAAFAQTPPSNDQGPRFGQWGPGQSAPAPEGPAGGEAPSTQRDAPAPGAQPDAARPGFPGSSPYAAPPAFPGPALPPAPDRWGGCNYDLRGNWQISGRQTDPYPFSYSSWVQVRQFRNWLQIDQPEDNLSYYGVCRGDYIELDVYAGGRFVGYEDGVVSGNSGGGTPWSRMGFNPRWGSTRIRAEWTSFFGGFASGRETWYRW
jgi:hypothetical protein